MKQNKMAKKDWAEAADGEIKHVTAKEKSWATQLARQPQERK